MEDDSRDVFLVGLSHQTSDVEMREQFVTEQVDQLLGELRELGSGESAVLFTCNRVEVYGVSPGDAPRGAELVAGHLARRCGVEASRLAGHLYSATGHAAAMHLLRVSAGLESLVLGESQILGQVAGAAERATAGGAMGPVLSDLFRTAVEAGKRVRSETEIGRNTLSISHAGVLLAKSQRADFASARVLIVGAGEMARMGIAAVRSQGNESIVVVNRTDARAAELAVACGVGWVRWSKLREAVAVADVIIAATSSARAILAAGDLPRDGAVRHIIDVGVPRNVDVSVREVVGTVLHDVDDLRNVVGEHRAQREQQVGRVEALLREEFGRYLERGRSRRMGPVIVELREKMRAMAAAELERALRRLPNADAATREAMEMMAHRIVAKVVHGPMVAMKQPDSQGKVKVLREFFELSDGPPKEGAEREGAEREGAKKEGAEKEGD